MSAEYPANAPPHRDGLPLNGDMITCDFRLFATGTDTDGKPGISLTQNTPLILSFARLTTRKPVMKSSGGETDLTFAQNDPHQVVLVERNALGNVFTYSISRTTGLAVWTKGYVSFNGSPIGVLSVGRCY
jgi:hypothetical protein